MGLFSWISTDIGGARQLPLPAMLVFVLNGLWHALTMLVLLKGFVICFLTWGRSDGSGNARGEPSIASGGLRDARCSIRGALWALLRLAKDLVLTALAVWLLTLLCRNGLAVAAWCLVGFFYLYLLVLTDMRMKG